ncbi:hypothetical protein Lsai_1793 [Legionella sainthelensi]|uniref:Uncharacterized protein n=1 Tax=Legionella sainthelensi TaxID=28087 RepID=A0A0W0YJY0_9GAMM|nr:hypothetical protein [Legionella sainthelensi]KTD57189.1 hypothetical protein Lsai_1793 [Legionella sainthelensi]VEH37529.1 Uncharacterised protein [Legionella sainthelensi]
MTTLKQQQAQREYFEKITARAMQQALQKNPSSLLFDPQGRILIDVTISEQEQGLFKQGFGNTRVPSPITTVSLDVTQIKELNEAYERRYGLDKLNKEQLERLSTVRGSIIPLHQEFHFHLALAARTYTKVDPRRFPKEQMEIAHQEAMRRIQPLIEQAFADALRMAKEDGKINAVKLIQQLDKARNKISAEAHSILMEEVLKETGQRLSKEDLKKIEKKHLAEKTTASPNDLLHIDQSLEQTIWISGSENTAHERLRHQSEVYALADRQIVTLALKEEHQGRARLQIRTPSLDVKKNLSMDSAIDDVSVKLLALAEKYSIHSISENPLGRKAFTYNLHTTINHTLDDWFKDNKQSWGAQAILNGAHLYNKVQLESKEPKPFCFVQNLSVNGFGDSLGYGWNIGWNRLRNEATLMAEMAMLQNLVGPQDNLPEIQRVFEYYEQFLIHCKNRGANYFSRSPEGQLAIAQIKKIKAEWTQPDARIHEEDATPVEKAKKALKIIMANDLHHTHEYAKLVQSLSLFIEEASIAGCKSGNERAQAINGRVAILDHEASKPESIIFKAIAALAQANPSDVKKFASDLKRHLDDKYNNHLQTGLSLISDVDQGASAKVNAKAPWYKFWTKLNPNYAEESSLTHLSQKKSGNMQAHKGLTTAMAAAAGYPQSFGSYLGLGKLGMALGIITLPISLLVVSGIYLFSYKPYKETLITKAELRIKECEKIYLERIERNSQIIVASYEKANLQLHEPKGAAERGMSVKDQLVMDQEQEGEHPDTPLKSFAGLNEPLNVKAKDINHHMSQFTGVVAQIKIRQQKEDSEKIDYEGSSLKIKH